jgi:hypothetical protein
MLSHQRLRRSRLDKYGHVKSVGDHVDKTMMYVLVEEHLLINDTV